MARFSKALRERIVREFTARHNGRFDPAVFVEEVREAGPTHEAHAWFQWDDEAAAEQYRIEQARSFIQGVQITFTVENVVRGKVAVREQMVPLALSPLSGRREGGGYVVSDPKNPDYMSEFCLQAARDLAAWLRRYRAALEYAGGSPVAVERQAQQLSDVSERQEIARAA